MSSPAYSDLMLGESETKDVGQSEAANTRENPVKKAMKRIKKAIPTPIKNTLDKIKYRMSRIGRRILKIIKSIFVTTVWFRFLADLFPLAGLAVLFFSFLSPVIWKLNPSPAMQLRPYVAPEGYLPDIQCTINSNNLLAALVLNNTNLTAPASLANTSVMVQQLFAKGGGSKGGGEGDSGLGDFFGALGDAFDAVSGIASDASPSNIAPHGNFDEHPNATVRLWIGPLGSCSRDLDGRKWCTKPSYRHPKYNISSFVHPNAYLYPAIIQAQTLGKTTLAFIVFACISCILSFIGDIHPKLNWGVGIYNIIILIGESVILWVWASKGFIEAAPGVRDPRELNTINSLFQCNQTSGNIQLNPGIQYYILLGDHYGLLWASLVLVYVLGTVAAIIRGVLGGGFD